MSTAASACIGSRSAPERVFHQQVGDTPVPPVARNMPNAAVLGSFEYATKLVGAKSIFTLGHNHRGTAKGTM